MLIVPIIIGSVESVSFQFIHALCGTKYRTILNDIQFIHKLVYHVCAVDEKTNTSWFFLCLLNFWHGHFQRFKHVVCMDYVHCF